MAYGLNRVSLIGRLGADVDVRILNSGKRVASMRIATDDSFMQDGERRDATEWHTVVTFQDGLIGMLERRGRRGRKIYVEGKLRTRSWRKPGEDSDRYATEVLVTPGCALSFLDPAPVDADAGDDVPV